MIQAPLLGVLISLVANGKQFETMGATKPLMFALSCSAFWIGILNAIQEICKERNILKREYMTGLSLGSYIRSKIIVLGGMCLVQTAMVILVFLVGVSLKASVPGSGVILPFVVEIFISVFLTALSASAMGLLVSSMFDNPDKAMVVAPILLMPQILFSGQLFTFEEGSIMNVISWLVICRWSMEGLGSTCDFNGLAVQQAMEKAGYSGYGYSSSMGSMAGVEEDAMFAATTEHMLMVWGILLGMTVLFLALS